MPDVHGMLRTMSWRQFTAWGAYAQVEPFGELRADLRAGQIASILANTNRDPAKMPKPFSMWDFVIAGGEERADTRTGKPEPVRTNEQWSGFKSAFTQEAKSEDAAYRARAERADRVRARREEKLAAIAERRAEHNRRKRGVAP